MRKLLILLSILACLTPGLASADGWYYAAPAASGNIPGWFGVTDETGYGWNTYAGLISNWNVNVSYLCPGTGNRTLTNLVLWVKKTGDSYKRFKLAIYDESGNKVCEGSAYVTVVSTTGAWEGHTAFTGSTTLTGGSYYRFGVSRHEEVQEGYKTGSSNDNSYSFGNYFDDPWPTTIPSGTGNDMNPVIKAYVE